MEYDYPSPLVKVLHETKNESDGYVAVTGIFLSYNGEEYQTDYYFSLDTGHWIGDADTALCLCKKKGLRQIQKAHDQDCVASIGYNPYQQKWYGWSHRAVFCFGIGDKLFEEGFGDENTPYNQHGSVTIETLEQAKQAAINFADYIS